MTVLAPLLSSETVVVVVIILTLTRIVESPWSQDRLQFLEWKNTPGKNTRKPKVVHAYTMAEATLGPLETQ